MKPQSDLTQRIEICNPSYPYPYPFPYIHRTQSVSIAPLVKHLRPIVEGEHHHLGDLEALETASPPDPVEAEAGGGGRGKIIIGLDKKQIHTTFETLYKALVMHPKKKYTLSKIPHTRNQKKHFLAIFLNII